MIPQAELRIGNCVNHLGTPTELKSGAQIDKNYEQLQPIPLTPELLTACGFENGNAEVSNVDLWDHYWIGDFEIVFSDGAFRYSDTIVPYLHHLQNLYFAIVGQELTINLPQTVYP